MNIFYISTCPSEAAKMLVNRHVVSQIKESTQLLSTAHRILDGKMVIIPNKNGRKMKRWILDDSTKDAKTAPTEGVCFLPVEAHLILKPCCAHFGCSDSRDFPLLKA